MNSFAFDHNSFKLKATLHRAENFREMIGPVEELLTRAQENASEDEDEDEEDDDDSERQVTQAATLESLDHAGLEADDDAMDEELGDEATEPGGAEGTGEARTVVVDGQRRLTGGLAEATGDVEPSQSPSAGVDDWFEEGSRRQGYKAAAEKAPGDDDENA